MSAPRHSSNKLPAILDDSLNFPDPSKAANTGSWKGLVAIGGDLSVPRLLLAYRSGIFPWTINPITWWSPDPRAVIGLDDLHVSRSLARILRHNPFAITFNRAFRDVMEACACPAPGREQTWISHEFIDAYTRLHEHGHVHSIECWQEERLVGGIYGMACGGLFAGESMFHRASNASKVALFHLVEHLRNRGFALFDVQMLTPVTAQMGAREITRAEYLCRLQEAVNVGCAFTHGDSETPLIEGMEF